MTFAPECFWAFQTRATFWAIFRKISLGPPFALFQKKMRVLGDLAKIVITWPFGRSLEPLFAPKSFPVLAL